MRLIVTSVESLNNTNDELITLSQDDIVCVFYESTSDGLNIETVDKLLSNQNKRYFKKVSENKGLSAAFYIGKLLGENDAADVAFKTNEEWLKNVEKELKSIGIKCVMYQKKKTERTKEAQMPITEVKIPKKRGRKPKQKVEEVVNNIA